jgi:hypothetical protein
MRSANTPAARRARPWLIVLTHRPLYSTAPWYENTRERGVPGTAGDLVHALEALIAEEGGADLVIAGHVHEYERSHATRRNGKVVARGGKVTHYHQGTSPCVFHEVFYI